MLLLFVWPLSALTFVAFQLEIILCLCIFYVMITRLQCTLLPCLPFMDYNFSDKTLHGPWLSWLVNWVSCFCDYIPQNVWCVLSVKSCECFKLLIISIWVKLFMTNGDYGTLFIELGQGDLDINRLLRCSFDLYIPWFPVCLHIHLENSSEGLSSVVQLLFRPVVCSAQWCYVYHFGF